MESGFFKSSVLVFAIALTATAARASVIFLYDFPGNPGSGLAADQTNGQPAGATFSDFTRTADLTQMPGAPANNDYGTENWNQTGSINTAQYEGFSITAAVGNHLNLTSLSFDIQLKPSGPLNVEVGLFLNGSSTAYATLDLTPTASVTTYNFNFTPLTDADNVTLAEFRFFGWNAAASGGGIVLDNVATSGSIGFPVPEAGTFGPVLVLVSCTIFLQACQGKRPGLRSNQTMKRIASAMLRKLRLEDWFKSKRSSLPAAIRLSVSR